MGLYTQGQVQRFRVGGLLLKCGYMQKCHFIKRQVFPLSKPYKIAS